MHSTLHTVDYSAKDCWVNEWPTNSSEVLDSWVVCCFMWIPPHCLWSLLHRLTLQPWFKPALYISMVSSLSSLFLYSDSEGTSSAHSLSSLALKACCSFVLAPEGCVHACLIFIPPFSWPGETISYVQCPNFTIQTQTHPCQTQIKVRREESWTLTNVFWPAAWILLETFLLESELWVA